MDLALDLATIVTSLPAPVQIPFVNRLLNADNALVIAIAGTPSR